MKLKALIIISVFMITVSTQAMKSGENTQQTVKNLIGYNGRMEEDYENKRVRWAQPYNRKQRRAHQTSPNITMELLDDGFMQPSSIQEDLGFLALVICCGPCIIIGKECCPNQSN